MIKLDKIVALVDAGHSLQQIAEQNDTSTDELYRVIREHLGIETLTELARQRETPTSIAAMYGVSTATIYKRIRHLHLVHLFYDQLVGCRDVCPALIRIMAMTGANIHTVHVAAYPQISYNRLRRFIERECMFHYFDGPILPPVQWVERVPPLFHIEDIATRVSRNDSPASYTAKEINAPALRTVYNRLGVNNWHHARQRAQEVLSAAG